MNEIKDPLLRKLELETYRALGQDDKTGGEGAWTFYLATNGTDRVAVPPDGTWGSTLQAVAPKVIAAMGGGHVADVAVDPADPGGPRRKAIVVGGPYADPAEGDDEAKVGIAVPRYYWLQEDGRWLVSKTPDGERYPVPAGPVNVPPPPPPAQGEG